MKCDYDDKTAFYFIEQKQPYGCEWYLCLACAGVAQANGENVLALEFD